ncbi:MAG: hypothetical protein LJE83_04465 [Gammaproteobacteria bacterium]|nr:hypothetical protein [Gammaproteobacteria bacterium]
MYKQLFSKSITAAMLTISMAFVGPVSAGEDQPADMERLQKLLQQQISLMKPELQKKVKALSPATKKSLLKILSQHSIYSERATLRQVMQEVLSDYQSMVAGVMTDNPEQASASALRIANHRIPVGGLLPYLGIENINDGKLAALEGFNDSVEGKARELAKAADNNDMATASSLVGEIASGCVGCHVIFRGQPGISNLLK